jgi:hypothetical protein
MLSNAPHWGMCAGTAPPGVCVCVCAGKAILNRCGGGSLQLRLCAGHCGPGLGGPWPVTVPSIQSGQGRPKSRPGPACFDSGANREQLQMLESSCRSGAPLRSCPMTPISRIFLSIPIPSPERERKRERDTVGTRILFFGSENLYIAIVLKHLETDNEKELKRLEICFQST